MASTLSIAGTALASQQAVLQTLGHNIANAATKGYTRQEAVVRAKDPAVLPYGSVGAGVEVATVVRQRNELLDLGVRASSGSASAAQMRRDQLSQLEALFGEPSDKGMGQALDDFFNAWSELANTPTSGGARSLVRLKGQRVAELFNNFDTELSRQRNTAVEQLRITLDQVNGLARQIGQLNGSILASEASGRPNNDLRDRRDVALDDLARLTGAMVERQKDGTVNVNVGTLRLIEGVRVEELGMGYEAGTTSPVDTPVRLQTADGKVAGNAQGTVGALTDAINTAIPQLRGRLDATARALVASVNATHRQGFVFTGTTVPGVAAGDFFAPSTLASPVRAGTIQLDAAVAADAGRIAASGDANAPANNQLARQLAGLRDTPDTVQWTGPDGTTDRGSFPGFFRDTVTRLGMDVRTAEDDADLYGTLLEQANTRRQTDNGVNVDEELMQIVQVQQAYQAASKLVKSMDEMLQTILQMI